MKALGQGSERFAFQFYQVGKDKKTIVGKPFMAKDSFYRQSGDADKAVRKFYTTQQFTKRIAEEFNQKLDSF